MTRIRILTALIAGILPVLTSVADESDKAENTADSIVGAERCISLTRLDRTDIIDDRNIVFHMRTDEIYLNQLPNRCPGLKSAGRFSYRPTVNRLCNTDSIRILRDAGPGGLGLREGVGCRLGYFKPITEDEIVVLKGEDVPETEVEGEGAEIEPIEEDAPDEPAEIESVD